MARTKRRYHHKHEEYLHKRLKYTLIAIFLIPIAVLAMFVFFGPVVGSLISIFSSDDGGQSQNVIAPSAPIFENPPKSVNSTSIKLTGFAPSGNTIKLFVNGPEQQTAIATNDGTFTFDSIELIQGRNAIFAKTVDSNGIESTKSMTIFVNYDDKEPDIEIESPKDEETVRNLNKRIVIKGSVSEKAKVTINDKVVVQKPDLSFEFPLGVSPGWIDIKVNATDEAGNSNDVEFRVLYQEESN